MQIWFVLTPGVLLLDYAGPAEALRMAAEMGAELNLHTVAPVACLRCSLGIELAGLAPLPDPLPPDSLVITVGNANEHEDYASAEARAVVAWLRTVARQDTRFASVCSGALLLADAGLLAGRGCTTHHALIDELGRRAPSARVEHNRVFVEDGPVVTSAGITTGIDLALYLVERHFGAPLAAAVARRLVMFLRRSGHDPQLSPWLAWRNHLHPAVHRAQDAIARDPSRRWSADQLAAVAHVSARHLSRLFVEHAGVGLVEYQQRLRLARARMLLDDARLPIERVAELAGFGSARDLRRVWRRHHAEEMRGGDRPARRVAPAGARP